MINVRTVSHSMQPKEEYKMIKLAIHHREGSYSEYWLQYCKNNNIPFKIVNCYDSDIIHQIKDCDGLMWHWHHNDYKAKHFALSLIISLEKIGINVFPNFNTCWFFDDKIGQKYILESIGAPLISTYIFYDKKSALNWIDTTTFPKIFKLRGGAGSLNVKLIPNRLKAKNIVMQAFNNGFPSVDKRSNIKERFWVFRRDKDIKSLTHIVKGFARSLIPRNEFVLLPEQKGYVYFQDYIKNVQDETRVIIIGDKAFAYIRYNRDNDFKASGSGKKNYDHNIIKNKCIEIAFDISETLRLQSCAFDIIFNNGTPLIVEMSYAFGNPQYTGYWDKYLEWHPGPCRPQVCMVENFIQTIISEKILV